MSEDRFAASAREYVESLHQNSRTHLLYGKNNVLVQPVLLQNPPPTATLSVITSVQARADRWNLSLLLGFIEAAHFHSILKKRVWSGRRAPSWL